jgi:hypothetical protein
VVRTDSNVVRTDSNVVRTDSNFFGALEYMGKRNSPKIAGKFWIEEMNKELNYEYRKKIRIEI